MESHPNQYSPNPENQREGGGDYRAMLSSIRADQNRETFVADLRQRAEPLLSLAQNLMRNRGSTQEERRAYVSVGGYLDIVLKQYVFDIDPFISNKHPDDVQHYEDRQAIGHEFIQKAASRWLDRHPDSESAREVMRLGIFAFPDQHQELLQEMWPSLRAVAIHSLEMRK